MSKEQKTLKSCYILDRLREWFEFYETINIDTVIGQVNDLENFIRIYNIENCKVVKVEIKEIEDGKID